MKREIKFRGKSIQTGHWVYGCLVNNMWTYSELSKFKTGTPVCEIITGKYESDCWEEAITEDSNIITVDPETVGQYAGLKDKNIQDIYEGDILEIPGKHGARGIMEWQSERGEWSMFHPLNRFEIIGNVFEHPELLE